MKTRAAVLRRMGHSRPYAGSAPLQIEEVELGPPGPREVLVEVKAAGLCHSDLSVIDGSRPRPMPMVLGHETAGIVRELGAGVVGFEPGDHVVLSFLLTNGGVEVAFEAVGNAVVLGQAYAASARGGTTVTIGLPDPSQLLQISAVSIVAEERTIKGSYMGSCVPRRDIPRYVALYRSGMLPVDTLHTKTIALDQINAGCFDALASGDEVRQIVAM